MTERLYYTDARVLRFRARVVSCTRAGDRSAVVLDRTAFYPTSGGQPFDTGTLGGLAVRDVSTDEGDVVHVVDGVLDPGAEVDGVVDAARRADHTQQHSGQHVLSAAFARVHGADTVGFHMGPEVSTIDLDRDLAAAEIAAAELEANRVVWSDVPVQVSFVDAEVARALPLRKVPGRAGTLRIVDIMGVDVSACGGTHVGRTGMIGAIAITGWERWRTGVRVTFVCGGRAVTAHRRLRDLVTDLTRTLSVTPVALVERVEQVLAELRDAQRSRKALAEELITARAAEWRLEAEPLGDVRLVLRTDPTMDAGLLKVAAQAIAREPGHVAMLVGGGHPAPVVIARAADVIKMDAGDSIRAITAAFGGRGGGRSELAQAGVPAAASEIVTFLRQRLAP